MTSMPSWRLLDRQPLVVIHRRSLRARHQVAVPRRGLGCYRGVNAVAESFSASRQCELLDRHTWPTRAGLARAMFQCIGTFYNRPAATSPSATSAPATSRPPARHDPHTNPVRHPGTTPTDSATCPASQPLGWLRGKNLKVEERQRLATSAPCSHTPRLWLSRKRRLPSTAARLR